MVDDATARRRAAYRARQAKATPPTIGRRPRPAAPRPAAPRSVVPPPVPRQPPAPVRRPPAVGTEPTRAGIGRYALLGHSGALTVFFLMVLEFWWQLPITWALELGRNWPAPAEQAALLFNDSDYRQTASSILQLGVPQLWVGSLAAALIGLTVRRRCPWPALQVLAGSGAALYGAAAVYAYGANLLMLWPLSLVLFGLSAIIFRASTRAR